MKLKANRDTVIKFKLDQSQNLDSFSEFINLKEGFILDIIKVLKNEKSHQLVNSRYLNGWIYSPHWDKLKTQNNNSKWLWESIKEFEGFRPRPYYDTGGILTIGFGRTHDISLNEVTTIEKEKEWTLNYLTNIKEEIKKLVKIKLQENQLDALAHFVYNIGINAFKNSTLLKKLNTHDIKGAANEFLRWNKDAKRVVLVGLVRRRKHERDHFLGIDN